MADKQQDDQITNAELVADDPGLTKVPTGILLEQENTLNPKVVKEAEEEIKESDKKK